MDDEASAMQWCPDAVDSRLYEVFYYTLEGKKRKWQGREASALGGLGNGWRRYHGNKASMQLPVKIRQEHDSSFLEHVVTV